MRFFPFSLGRQAVLGLLLCLAASAQSPPEPPSLPSQTPRALIAEVLAYHPAVRKAQHLVDAAQATLEGSRLQPNPTLTLAATAGDASENSNALTQTFEISGQPRLRQEQAQARLDSALLGLRSARRAVAAAVCSDWLALWESRHLAIMAQLRLSLMNDMVRVTRRRYEVGEIPQNESLRVQLAAAEAEADWKRAEAAYLSAQRTLWLLRGQTASQDPATALAAAPAVASGEFLEMLFEAPELLSVATPWTLEQVLEAADTHLDVAALRQEQKALSLSAELLAKERAPQLGVSLYRSRFFGQSIEQGAQVYFSWPIFDWGSISARKRAQQSEAAAQLAAADEKVLDLRRQVADTWSDWQSARAVREILQGQAKRYEELAREARIGYDLGMLTLTDVLQTETAFRQAGVQLIEAQAEVFRLELGLLERTSLPWPSDLLEEQ